ncbi:radical SAM protein [Sorangium sp. So ce1014]|uniref:B12-binding domain-containing radical SAM protein n=1 Tax=Sorangium sp. So ce1014 TaxID=3133326 RepID=UPI003F621913
MSGPVDWLLAFPPLVSSNWGHYYPAPAVLAAALAARGDRVQQMDLNARFLDYLVAPARLERLERSFRERGRTSGDDIPTRSAVALLRESPQLLLDDRGRQRALDGHVGNEMATELARPYHLDLPVERIAAPDFADTEAARAYADFFGVSGLDRALDGALAAVGLSVPMGPQIAPAALVARYVRRRRPDVRIIAGGPAITLMKSQLLQLLLGAYFDAAVRFEGETAIVELSRQLAEGRWDPGSVPGVDAPCTAARAWEGSRPPRVRELRIPEYDPAQLERLAEPRLGVLQARGCYWGECAYCDFVELYSDGRRYDQRPTDRIADEMAEIERRHGVRAFWLITEALPPRQGLSFARALNERQLRIDWRSFAMVEEGFTTPLLAELRASGCTSLTVGLETTNSRVLALVRKKVRREENLAFLSRVRDAGLCIDLNLIPNLPTTTRDEALAVLDDLRPFMSVMRTVAVFPFEATASSEIAAAPTRYGLKVVGNCTEHGEPFPHGQAQYASNRLIYRDGGMGPEELLEVTTAYTAFATEVRATRARIAQTANGATKRGYRLRPIVAVLADADSTLCYDWERDHALRVGPEWYDVLRWWRAQSSPITQGELANRLASRMKLSQIPGQVGDLLARLCRAGGVEHVT